MKLLAIDTSTGIASVALMVGSEMLCEEQDGQKTHAQLVLPMIDRLIVQSGITLNLLDGIIFGCGPGSFTGLRIACSIAKGLAYAHDLDLIPVSSLGSIAWAVRELEEFQHACVLAVMDARMQELYWSYFATDTLIASDRVSPAQDLHVPAVQPVVLAGVGIDTYWDAFPEHLKSQIVTKLNLYPNAAAMIRLSQRAAIRPVPIAQAQPIYVRNQVTQGGSRG